MGLEGGKGVEPWGISRERAFHAKEKALRGKLCLACFEEHQRSHSATVAGISNNFSFRKKGGILWEGTSLSINHLLKGI